MADKPITKQELINASIDAVTLGEATNEDKIVQSRYGGPYKSVPMVSREGDDAVEVIKRAGLKVQMTASTSFAEPELVFGIYIIPREFFISKNDRHIASSDAAAAVRVGIYKNDVIFGEIVFSNGGYQFDLGAEQIEFQRGDIISLKITEFHFSVKKIAVSLVGRFQIYDLE
jgi:hypothetical protein